MSELPDDLADLERRLAARTQSQLNATLRQQVLASVRNELSRETNSIWRFAAALAATVLLGTYLSMSAALCMDWGRGEEESGEIEATIQQLQRLDPAMSEHEARRQVLMWQTRAHLACTPVLALPPEYGRRERESFRYVPR
jgi:hypothetical protein